MGSQIFNISRGGKTGNSVLFPAVSECTVQKIALIHNSSRFAALCMSRWSVGLVLWKFSQGIWSNGLCHNYGDDILACVSHTLHLLRLWFSQDPPLVPRSVRLLGFDYLLKCVVEVDSTAGSGNVGSWSASANYVKLRVAARGFSVKQLVVKQPWKKRQVQFINYWSLYYDFY